MIQAVLDFALRNRILVLAGGVLLLVWGYISFHNLPVEAYPDVANNYVNVITQWPGRAAEEVEQQVTIPIEMEMNGVGHLMALRSVSLFGLSSVTMIFDDNSENLMNREQVLEKLSMVNLPAGLSPQIGPDFSPIGQIYFYTLASTNPEYDVMDLKAIQDWVVLKQLKSVPDVADVATFGGITREYQVQLDPNQLVNYGLSVAEVEQAIAGNNTNAGGSFIEHGEQAFNIRAVGLADNTADIGQTLLKVRNGTPVRVRDVGYVTQGPKIRLGKLGKAIHHENRRVIDYPDVVEGVVLMRKGAEPETVLAALHRKVRFLNEHFLPPGVKIVPYLDRDDLVHMTTHTVLHNLLEGVFLVVAVLFLFLGNLRSALIVAITIPFALLFAAICLDVRHIPANLLSLGALDFGMVVDGSVVMVENILRHLGSRYDNDDRTIRQKIAAAAHEVQRPVFFARLIIITAYVPIFTLQRVEGRLFRPMAWTVAFALLGALVFTLLHAPVLSSYLFGSGAKEWRNPVMEWLTRKYRRTLLWGVRRRLVTLAVPGLLLAIAIGLMWFGFVGSEFLPHLDEGAIWARGTLAPSTGPTDGIDVMNRARKSFARFPEVTQVVSQVGRPDDGTDATGFFNTEYFVDLKPRNQWRPEFHGDKSELIAALDREVSKIPGVIWNYSQPIADNVEEAVTGIKGELAVKIFGADLKVLEQKADEIVAVMKDVPGVADLGIFRVIGQPNVNLVVNREKAARYGINVNDVQDAIQTAVGSGVVSTVLRGEERYDLTVRYQQPFRSTIEQIGDIRLLAPSGERVALTQLCDVRVEDGASMIYRESNSRYVAIKYSVRQRDLGSTVEEAIRRVSAKVALPPGYTIDWAGEYESQKRANARLAVIVPVTVLIMFLLLYSAFHSFKWAGVAMVTIALAPIGGIFALFLTGTHFSVSSGVGFLALFGVAVETGVIMIEYINQLRARGHDVMTAAIEGAVLRLRPVIMTALVATLGLLPAAMSHGIGSDSQRPFAIVIVGGLCATLVLSVIVLPTVYVWVAGPNDELPVPHAGDEGP